MAIANLHGGSVSVSCLQVASDPAESVADRRRRVAAAVASRVHADFVVLPELWPTGYFAFDEYESCAEPLDGPTLASLATAARSADATVVGGSFIERVPGGGLANTTIVLDRSGRLVHRYRKIHLFGHDSEEANLLTPGTDLPVTQTDVGWIGTATCYDLRFPELFRLLADQGVEIIVIPSAWPAQRQEHWRLLVRARAVENLAYVVATNATRSQGTTELAGHSLVVDPWGEVLAEAGTGEETLEAALDLEHLRKLREAFPVLDHRRLQPSVGASA